MTFDELLARAESLKRGDRAGFKALIDDMLAGGFTLLDCEILLKAAVGKCGFRIKPARELFARTKAEFDEARKNTPEALDAERRRLEAQAAAARIVREEERKRLWQSCSKIAMSKTLLADMEDVVHRLGVVREGSAIRAIYLAAMSRLGARTICLLRRGASAGGKNYPITVALELIPEDSIVRLSSGSPLSLIYAPGGEDAFRLKIVYIPEAAFLAKRNGVESVFTYLLRTLISEGRLDHLVTVPQAKGPPVAMNIKRNGPVMIFLTSARKVEDEMQTRLVVSDADESQGQIEAVVLKDQRVGRPDGAVLEQWRDYQRWLEFDAPYKVAVPFSQAVSIAVVREIRGRGGVLPQRLKRDINAIFAAIEASAISYKAQRDCDGAGRIVATLDDYDNARAAFDVGLTTLYRLKTPETALAIVEAVEAIGATTEISVKVTVRGLMERTGLSSRQTAVDRLRDATERGFLIMDEPKGEKAPRYYKLGLTSAEVRAIIERGEERHVFPSREAIEQEIASPSPQSLGQVGQSDAPSENDRVINDLDAATLSQPPFGTEKDRLGQDGGDGDLVPPCPNLSQTGGGTERAAENKRKKGSFDGLSQLSHRKGPAPPSNGASALSPEDLVLAAQADGAVFNLFDDRTGFTIDLRLVADPVIRNLLSDAIGTGYEGILPVLLRGAAEAGPPSRQPEPPRATPQAYEVQGPAPPIGARCDVCGKGNSVSLGLTTSLTILSTTIPL